MRWCMTCISADRARAAIELFATELKILCWNVKDRTTLLLSNDTLLVHWQTVFRKFSLLATAGYIDN